MGYEFLEKFCAEAQNLKTGNDPCNLGKIEYFYLKIDILSIPKNFMDPRFDFSRISYNFSKLNKKSAQNYYTSVFSKIKGNKLEIIPPRGKRVISY